MDIAIGALFYLRLLQAPCEKTVSAICLLQHVTTQVLAHAQQLISVAWTFCRCYNSSTIKIERGLGCCADRKFTRQGWVAAQTAILDTWLNRLPKYLMISSHLTNCLTPRSTVFLEKLIVSWLTSKFCTFYQNPRFTMFAISCHMSLYWARSVQSVTATLFLETANVSIIH
jgi:hypothetical protein